MLAYSPLACLPCTVCLFDESRRDQREESDDEINHEELDKIEQQDVKSEDDLHDFFSEMLEQSQTRAEIDINERVCTNTDTGER